MLQADLKQQINQSTHAAKRNGESCQWQKLSNIKESLEQYDKPAITDAVEKIMNVLNNTIKDINEQLKGLCDE